MVGGAIWRFVALVTCHSAPRRSLHPVNSILSPDPYKKDSVNSAVLENVSKMSSGKFDLGSYEDLADLLIFNEHLEGENTPNVAVGLGKAVLEADAVLISKPEYNCAILGGIKNLLD